MDDGWPTRMRRDITLTSQGTVMSIPRKRASPADRGIGTSDVFQGVLDRQLALPASSSVGDEERAFLKEVAVSGMQELQEERRRREQ